MQTRHFVRHLRRRCSVLVRLKYVVCLFQIRLYSLSKNVSGKSRIIEYLFVFTLGLFLSFRESTFRALLKVEPHTKTVSCVSETGWFLWVLYTPRSLVFFKQFPLWRLDGRRTAILFLSLFAMIIHVSKWILLSQPISAILPRRKDASSFILKETLPVCCHEWMPSFVNANYLPRTALLYLRTVGLTCMFKFSLWLQSN